LLIIGFICALTIWLNSEKSQPHLTLKTLYGTFDIHEPVLIELLNSDELQRLKHIHQYGVTRYAIPTEEFNRYEHSVGVFALLRRYEAPLEEQIAGLLHDASHSVFSHVADWIFINQPWTGTYADDIHGWFLQHSNLAVLLETHGYTPESINPQSGNFTALEQELPLLCADRIEYNLQGAVKRGIMDPADVEKILKDLEFEQGRWFFTSEESANQLASISLFMTENVWGEARGLMIYSWAAEALKRAMEIGTISIDDLHFSTDDAVWHRLLTSSDEQIASCVEKILNHQNEITLCERSERDTIAIGKFRGIDPLVKTDDGYSTLTNIDDSFNQEFSRVKEIMENGWPIKIVERHTAPKGLFPWNIDRSERFSTAGAGIGEW